MAYSDHGREQFEVLLQMTLAWNICILTAV